MLLTPRQVNANQLTLGNDFLGRVSILIPPYLTSGTYTVSVKGLTTTLEQPNVPGNSGSLAYFSTSGSQQGPYTTSCATLTVDNTGSLPYGFSPPGTVGPDRNMTVKWDKTRFPQSAYVRIAVQSALTNDIYSLTDTSPNTVYSYPMPGAYSLHVSNTGRATVQIPKQVSSGQYFTLIDGYDSNLYLESEGTTDFILD
jgi:hypothetical protein